jgi:hypothetical protein
MTVLKIMPGRKPERVSIPHTLESMQELVGGCIQAIYPYEDPVAIVCNEEGKLIGLEPNRTVRDPDTNEITDIICGPFFICGLGEEDFCSLTEEQATKYSKLFHSPEVFLWNGTNIVALAVDI